MSALKRKSIQQMWTEFQLQVMHPRSPAEQVYEMRRAFQAGFFAMFLISLRMGEDDVSENDAIDYLEQLTQEMMTEIDSMRMKVK